jgi:hypothetical protein
MPITKKRTETYSILKRQLRKVPKGGRLDRGQKLLFEAMIRDASKLEGEEKEKMLKQIQKIIKTYKEKK